MPKSLTLKLSGKLKRVFIPGIRPSAPASEDAGQAPAVTADMETLLKEAYSDGYQCAAKEWASRFTEMLKILDLEASRLNACRQEFMGSLEKNVIELGVAVAEKFLISERERRIYSINTIVNDIIEKMETKGGRLTIALNPDDWASFDEQAGLDAKELFQSIRIEADPAVPQAGCRLDTSLGRVAFSLEEQIDEIRQLLAKMEVPTHEPGFDDVDEVHGNQAPAMTNTTIENEAEAPVVEGAPMVEHETAVPQEIVEQTQPDEETDVLESPQPSIEASVEPIADDAAAPVESTEPATDTETNPETNLVTEPAQQDAQQMEENTITENQDVEAPENDGTVLEPEHA